MLASAAKNQQQRFKNYIKFKHKLLKLMQQKDPLGIVQSGIFQQYQKQNFKIINRKPITNQSANSINNSSLNGFQTVIKQYTIDGMKINMIQKRAYSSQSYLNKQNKYQEKIRMLKQQHKVDLAIWSNIMHNHFRVNQKREYKQIKKFKNQIKGENLESSRKNYQKQNQIVKNNIQNLQNIQMKKKLSGKVSQFYNATQLPVLSSSRSQNNLSTSRVIKICQKLPKSLQDIFQKMANKIITKPTKQNIKHGFAQIFYLVEQENIKVLNLMNQLRKQNQKIQKLQQQNSTKQLQYIVKIKQMQKRIQQLQEKLKKIDMKNRQKQQQMRNKQFNLNKTLLVKHRQLQHLQKQKTRKSYIQQLKQKMALDSIRRTTLCSLQKQKFDLQLKKEQLGLPLKYLDSSHQRQTSSVISQYTQETQCDD